MKTDNTATKAVISVYLETEEGKELVTKMKLYKNHCIDEKLKFYEMVKNNPELLNVGDNRLKYHCYIDDVIGVLSENITVKYLENLKHEQIKEKHDKIVKKK